MIIAFPTAKGGLDDLVIPSFGRAPTYTLVTLDDNTKEIVDVKVVQNPNVSLPAGAGIQAASYLTSLGVNIIIAPSVGPKAFSVLAQAGIQVFIGQGAVKDLVNAFIAGQLQPMSSMIPPGPGTGFGRGMGYGRGFGRGMGRGPGGNW